LYTAQIVKDMNRVDLICFGIVIVKGNLYTFDAFEYIEFSLN